MTSRRVVTVFVALVVIAASCTNGGSSDGADSGGGTTSTTPARNDAACPGAAWMDPSVEPAERADLLVEELTLEQKISQVHGAGEEADFRLVRGIEELCIPDLTVTNGPAGLGPGAVILEGVPATALPSPLLLGATWDPEMASRFGDVIGAEMVATGRNLMEAPNIDVARVPTNGRTFEAFGEDPLLVSQMGVAEIKAIQQHGILSMVKHFVVNNQETDRFSVSSEVSDRVLAELYYPPFEAAVTEADVSSFMCSYNRVNGVYACENEDLLTGVLRDDWDFDGFVQSDFFAQLDTVISTRAGVDLEMPNGNTFGTPLLEAVQSGEVPEAILDTMVARRFTQMFRIGTFDRPPSTAELPVRKHAAQARTIAAAGTVLLRNENDLLPLDDSALDTIAVVGPYADQTAVGGGGSSQVTPLRTITPVEGIESRLGAEVTVLTDDGADPAAAAAVAAEADVVVVVVGDRQSESVDRENLTLVDDQDALIAAVAAANPATVVVVHAGAPVTMPWLDDVGAVVMGWYPGQEDGTVTASILFGDVEPSGRLPITFPRSDGDVPANTPERYPGVNGEVFYSEGLEVGYRHYTANDIDPLFPFGFGLSYTSFELSDMSVEPERLSAGDEVSVTVRVRNTGDRAGREVVQVYVAYPDEIGEPPLQLRGLAKVELEPGASREIEITLNARAFAYWDTEAADWRTAPGNYRVLVGTSSEDVPFTTKVTIRG